jgi:hypothetical protein
MKHILCSVNFYKSSSLWHNWTNQMICVHFWISAYLCFLLLIFFHILPFISSDDQDYTIIWNAISSFGYITLQLCGTIVSYVWNENVLSLHDLFVLDLDVWWSDGWCFMLYRRTHLQEVCSISKSPGRRFCCRGELVPSISLDFDIDCGW